MDWSILFNALPALLNTIAGVRSVFFPPSQPQYGPQQTGPQSAPPAPPPQPEFGMEGLGEWMAGLQEMMAAQSGAFQQQMLSQQQQMQDQQNRGFARQAASTRRQLQSQGVYGNEDANLGAASSDAIAGMMGLSPEELRAALSQFGDEYGFNV